MNVTMNLEGTYKVKKVTVSYLENGDNWIFGPSAVAVMTSVDGNTFTPVYSYDLPDAWNASSIIKKIAATFPVTDARFIKVIMYNRGTCPQGSACAGKKAWLFVDEVTVE